MFFWLSGHDDTPYEKACEALMYIQKLSFTEAETTLLAHAKALVKSAPTETTNLLMTICTPKGTHHYFCCVVCGFVHWVALTHHPHPTTTTRLPRMGQQPRTTQKQKRTTNVQQPRSVFAGIRGLQQRQGQQILLSTGIATVRQTTTKTMPTLPTLPTSTH